MQARKDPLAALDAAQAVGLPLVVVGPEKEPALAARAARRGADVRGCVAEGGARGALPPRGRARAARRAYEGFGIPVLEAMASGTPVVLSDDPALREVAGDAGVVRDDGDSRRGTRALADRDALRAAPGSSGRAQFIVARRRPR